MITPKKAHEICNIIFEKQKKINENNKIIREKNFDYICEYCNAEDENAGLRSEITAILDTIKVLEPKAQIVLLGDKKTGDELGVCVNGYNCYFK